MTSVSLSKREKTWAWPSPTPAGQYLLHSFMCLQPPQQIAKEESAQAFESIVPLWPSCQRPTPCDPPVWHLQPNRLRSPTYCTPPYQTEDSTRYREKNTTPAAA